MLRTFVALSALVALPAVALADMSGGTQTVQPNPNAKSQGNCVGVFSSQVTHNGVVVREQAQSGTRSQEVQMAREANCNTDTRAP